MNKNYTNNNFHGKINGKRAVDYYRMVDSKVKNVNDTITNAKDVLGVEEIDGVQFCNEFWTKIFLQNDEDEYLGGIKLILNKDDSLYSESNIAITLEKIASNILSKATKKDNPETFTKVFHSLALFNKAIDEREKFRGVINSTSDGKHALDKGLNDYFILANQMNYKHEKKITELDDTNLKKLNEIYGSEYPQVNDYYNAYISMKNKYIKMTRLTEEELENYSDEERKKHKFRKLNKEDKKISRIINQQVKLLREDFIDCINAKTRPIVFKAPLPDKGEPSWCEFDFFDKTHVRALLQVTKSEHDLQDDLSCIVRDLNNLIKQCDFTDIQNNVLKLWRKDKTQKDIGNILNIDISTVNRHITAIVNKIINKYEEIYTDYYYLNLVRGTYKRCNKCNKIKLVNNFARNGNGYRNTCKMCNNK